MSPFPPSVSSPRWDVVTKRTVTLICLVIAAFLFLGISDSLAIIVISTLLAFLLYPVASLIQRFFLFGPFNSRALAILLTFVVVGLLVSLLFVVIGPVLVGQLRDFTQNLPPLLNDLESSIEEMLSRPIVIGEQEFIPIDNIRQTMGLEADQSIELLQLDNFDLNSALSYSVSTLTGPAFSFIGGAFNAVINVVFLLTMLFYLLQDGSKFLRNLVAITPGSYQNDVYRLLHELGNVWNAYLRGQILLSLTMGVLVFLAATILGLPNAPILGLLAGLLEFIPNLGPLLATIPAVLLALVSQSSTFPFLEGFTFMLVVLAVWIALQQLEAIFLVPRIVGGSLNLHPYVVIIAVIAGANIGGALGIILAAPIIASIRVLGQYIYGKLLDKDPFPDSAPAEVEPSALADTPVVPEPAATRANSGEQQPQSAAE